MAVKRIIIHCIEIEDKPGSLQGFLEGVASANVDLLCCTAFSAGGGKGKIYIGAKDPEAFRGCAQELGISAKVATGFIVSGEDRVGACAEALKGLAEANINGVAGSAMAFDGQYQMVIVVNAADGKAAEKALRT